MLSLTAIVRIGAASDDVTVPVSTLQDWYDNGGLCSASRLDAITAYGPHVRVVLSVAPATRDALVRLPAAARDDWFGLHCPPDGAAFWASAPTSGDIAIGLRDDSALPAFSCRSWLDRQRAQHQRARSRVDRWLRYLFEQRLSD